MNVDLKLKQTFKFFENIDKEIQTDYKSVYFTKFLNQNKPVPNRRLDLEELLSLTLKSDYERETEIIQPKKSKIVDKREIEEFSEQISVSKVSFVNENYVNYVDADTFMSSTGLTRSHLNSISYDLPLRQNLDEISSIEEPKIKYKIIDNTKVDKITNKISVNKKPSNKLDMEVFTFRPEINSNSRRLAENYRSKSETKSKSEVKTPSPIKRQYDKNKIDLIYTKGINIIKKRLDIYNKNESTLKEEYKNYSYKPIIHSSNPIIDNEKRVLGDFISRQGMYSTQSNQELQTAVNQKQKEFNQIHTFKPEKPKSRLENDESIIMRNIEGINGYVNQRRRNISQNKAQKEYHDNLFNGSTFVTGQTRQFKNTLNTYNTPNYMQQLTRQNLDTSRSSLMTIDKTRSFRQDYNTECYFDDELSDIETVSKLNLNKNYRVNQSDLDIAIANITRLVKN